MTTAIPIQTDQDAEETKFEIPEQLSVNLRVRSDAQPGQVLVREIVDAEHGLSLSFPLLSYLFYGVLERTPTHLVCAQLVNESVGGNRNEVPTAEGTVIRQATIPSRQCAAGRHAVSFEDALFKPIQRQLIITSFIPFTESEYDNNSRWFLWHDKIVLHQVEYFPSKALMKQRQLDLDHLVINAMEPWFESLRPFPPDPSCGDFRREEYDPWYRAWIAQNAPSAEQQHRERLRLRSLLVQQIMKLPPEFIGEDTDHPPHPLSRFSGSPSAFEKMKQLHLAHVQTLSEVTASVIYAVRKSVEKVAFEERCVPLKSENRRFFNASDFQ